MRREPLLTYFFIGSALRSVLRVANFQMKKDNIKRKPLGSGYWLIWIEELFSLKYPATIGLNNLLRKTLKCLGNLGSRPDLSWAKSVEPHAMRQPHCSLSHSCPLCWLACRIATKVSVLGQLLNGPSPSAAWHQVILGHPHFRFPSGVQWRVVREMLPVACPIHLHRLCIMGARLTWLQQARRCWLEMVSGQNIRRILLTYSGYQSQSHAPFNDFFPFQKLSIGGRQSNVSMTIVVFISCQSHSHVRSPLDQI